MKRLLYPFALASLTVALAGCANLAAVRDYTKEAANTVGNKEAVTLYVTTEERLQSFRNDDSRDADRIQQRRTQVEAMLHLAEVLRIYFETLATLADDTLADYSKELGTVNRGLERVSAGQITAQQLGAAKTLGQLLARLATDTARHAKLRSILSESDNDVQIVIGALKDIAEKHIIDSLQTETAALQKYYGTLSAEIQNGPNPERLRAVVVLLRERQAELLDDRENEIAAVTSYGEALAKIAEGHRQLATAKSLSTRVLAKQLKAYEADLKACSKIISNL